MNLSFDTDRSMSELDDFFSSVETRNPFTDNRASGPVPDFLDAATIHQPAFERLTALAREALQAQRGLGVLLFGEAGVGKSHVLARLGRWALHDREALGIYLHNLQASPDHLPRSILKSVLSQLTGGQSLVLHRTPLFGLLRDVARIAMGQDPGYVSWSSLQVRFLNLLTEARRQRPLDAGLMDRTVDQVLFRFFKSAWRTGERKEDGAAGRAALHWLRGEALDTEEAALLDLRPPRDAEEGVFVEDNQQIKQVLVVLSQLIALRRQPFLLCFDQVDNLDPEQAAALARFLEALLDAAPNLLVVLAGIQATLLGWKQHGVIQESAWHRLAQDEIMLQRLTPEQARELIELRLGSFLAPFREQMALKEMLDHDPLFPLGVRWFEQQLGGQSELRPRDVINRARDEWRRQQQALRQEGGPQWLAGWLQRPAEAAEAVSLEPWSPDHRQEAIDACVSRKLDEQLAWRQEHHEMVDFDPDHLVGLLTRLLDGCCFASNPFGLEQVEIPTRARIGKPPTYDFVVHRRDAEGKSHRTGVLVMLAENNTSAAGFLRRLIEDAEPPERVLLVTQEQRLSGLGVQGARNLDALRGRRNSRFVALELGFGGYALLDVLQAVLNMGRAGELEMDGPGHVSQALTEDEVRAAYQRQNRYATAPVLSVLLGD
jgi:hypothetical protein